MRKLLLGTTALAAAATISANVAVADVSISGYYEWNYMSKSSDITANDGTTFGSDSEIAFKFANKTDSGLTIGMTTELYSDGGDTGIDEGSIAISGGFGKIVLGNNDFVGDNYGVSSTDLPAEEIYQTGVDSLAILGADITDAAGGDNNKVAYHLPAMGGLTAGVSFADSGATGSSDSTAIGARYGMSAGGAAVTLGYATKTKEGATVDTDTSSVGIKVALNDFTVMAANSTKEASGEDISTQSAGLSYKISDAMTVNFATVTSEDDIDTGEEYDANHYEAVYTIASGLTAVVNVSDWDYKKGSTSNNAGAVDMNGTTTKLTLKASF